MTSGFRKKTCRWPQTPTGQVRLELLHRRLNRLKPTMMLLEIPFDGDLYFSPDLHRICAKITRSKQKNIKSSPDFCKTHEIWAKIHQIVTGIFKKFAGICKTPIDLHQKSPKSAWISSNLAGSHQISLGSPRILPDLYITSVGSDGLGFGEENPPLDPPASSLRRGNPSSAVRVVGSGGFQFGFRWVAQVGRVSSWVGHP